jgi:biotin carboxylase
MTRILVTDGEQRAALAVTRSLGRAGHEVLVAASSPRSIAGASRFCAGRILVPDALVDPVAFREAVTRSVRDHSVGIVLPVAEPSILSLLEDPEAMGARVPPPGLEAFRAVSDKTALVSVAEDLGIATPPGMRVETGDRPAPGAEWFPAVLKPGRSVGTEEGRMRKHGVVHVADQAALDTALDGLPGSAFPLLLQKRIDGPGIGVFILMWGDEPVLTFGHRRVREKPPTGGVSVLKRSVLVDPDLLRRSVELLRAFQWEGVAMVEYKVDEATGTPYLMEVNGRFWGSLQLAVDAGADFPRVLVELMDGGTPGPRPSPRPGVSSRWFWGDIDHLIAVARGRGPADGRSRIGQTSRALIGLLASTRPGVRGDVLKLSDWRPFVVETRSWLRGGRG